MRSRTDSSELAQRPLRRQGVDSNHENGMSANDRIKDGSIDDSERSAFLDLHLDQVRRAIADGVPVNGYYIWSLMDNYEWSLGYEKRFGLVHIDFETLKRTPKASYHALAAALAR